MKKLRQLRKELDEKLQFKVDVEGMPPTFMSGKSSAEILAKLRKIVKQPSLIKSVERYTDMEVKRAYKNKAQGRDMEENYNWKVSHDGQDVHVKAPHAGAAVKKAQKGFGNKDLTKARIKNLGKVGTPTKESTELDEAKYSWNDVNTALTKANYMRGNPAHIDRVAKHFDYKSGNDKKFSHADVKKNLSKAGIDAARHHDVMKHMKEAVTYHGNPNKDDDARNAARRKRLAKQDNIMKKRAQDNEKARQALKDPDHNPAWANSKSKTEATYGTQGQRMMSPLQKVRQDKEKADRDKDGKLHMMKGRPKKVNEISQDLKKRYTDKAKSDYGHQQFSADIAREMGAKDSEKYYRRKQRNRMAGITKASK